METANPKTLELLSSIKRSRNISVDHLDALLGDYDRLGHQKFDEIVKTFFKTSARRNPSNLDEDSKKALNKLRSLEEDSSLNAELFIEKLLSKAVLIKVPPIKNKKDRTKPKLLAHFRSHATEDLLFKLAMEVTLENTRNR
jgi:hypothetical protein